MPAESDHVSLPSSSLDRASMASLGSGGVSMASAVSSSGGVSMASPLYGSGRGSAGSPCPVLARVSVPPCSGGLIWRRVFPGTLDQAPRAREFVRLLLADAPRADDAELIVSELVGNALRHSRSGEPGGWFVVEVMSHPLPGAENPGPDTAAAVLLTVYDCGGAGVPRFNRLERGGTPERDGGAAGNGGSEPHGEVERHGGLQRWGWPDDDEEGGRGLATVAAIAFRVGCQGSPSAGHRVWAYLCPACPAL